MVCRSCKSIVDTLIRTIDGGDWGDRRSTLEQLFTCPLCGSEDLDHWPRSHPCPRCDGSMKEIRGKVYWD